MAAIGAGARELQLPTVRADAARLAEIAVRERHTHLGPSSDKRELARRRAATTWPGRKGETGDERGEDIPPDPRFLAGRHLPAQFDRREPLAERMKPVPSYPCRAAAEQARRLDPGHPRLVLGRSCYLTGAKSSSWMLSGSRNTRTEAYGSSAIGDWVRGLSATSALRTPLASR